MGVTIVSKVFEMSKGWVLKASISTYKFSMGKDSDEVGRGGPEGGGNISWGKPERASHLQVACVGL